MADMICSLTMQLQDYIHPLTLILDHLTSKPVVLLKLTLAHAVSDSQETLKHNRTL